MYSAIIRCRNEEQWIGHAIQSIIDRIENPEIIVIDNHSTDESMDVVRMFEHHVDINKIYIDDYTPGKALNIGFQKAKYDHVLVLSSHCVLTDFDPQSHLDDLNSYVAIFGKQIPVYRGRRITPRNVWSHFGDLSVVNMYSEIEKRHFFHNAMSLYRKEMIMEHPFDEILYGKEDRYWAAKMVDAGHQYLYNPEMKCLHHWTTAGATWKGLG